MTDTIPDHSIPVIPSMEIAVAIVPYIPPRTAAAAIRIPGGGPDVSLDVRYRVTKSMLKFMKNRMSA